MKVALKLVPQVLFIRFWYCRMHAASSSVWKVVLTGDAAWCVTLLAGIGTMPALVGAYELASELAQSNESGDPGRAFAVYVLAQISEDELLCLVSADGAYDTKACHKAIAHRPATAIIPKRRNAKPWSESRAGAQARNEILRETRKFGRSIWKKWSGNYRRSLVETRMGCFKRLGERVMARDFKRQVTEPQIRASILNRFT